jgi:adenosylcobinamide hydrolase
LEDSVVTDNSKNRIVLRSIEAEVVSHRVWAVPANALLIKLPGHREVLSSREGYKKVNAICNCYLPKALWPKFQDEPEKWEPYLQSVLDHRGVQRDDTAALSTGVSMDHLAWQEASFEELWALAFVTAGVSSNAMRIGKDKASTVERNGAFDHAGTINTIVFTSVCLDLTPLAASFITITEAKNIALQEMDVRSTFTPAWQAKGTGTDQIVVGSGTSGRCRYVGGHTKLGEIIAQAVTGATVRAITNSLKAAG